MKICYLSSGGNEHSWFKAYAEKAIEILLSDHIEISSSNSHGGYLSVFKLSKFIDIPPKLEYLISCGEFSFEKRARYMLNSIEKGVRLNYYFLKDLHQTSRKSASEENEEYPGSIYFEGDERIFSFSGLDPVWDEFISVLISCFNYYFRKKREYPGSISVEDVLETFNRRYKLITATPEQLQIMFSTVNKLVEFEMRRS
jgi:hypothetical protein